MLVVVPAEMCTNIISNNQKQKYIKYGNCNQGYHRIKCLFEKFHVPSRWSDRAFKRVIVIEKMLDEYPRSESEETFNLEDSYGPTEGFDITEIFRDL